MSQWKISKDVHVRLCHMLAKEGLLTDIEESSFGTEVERMLRDGFHPIWWYARLSKFDEQSALKALAEKLSIPLMPLEKNAREKSAQLLKDSKLAGLSPQIWDDLRAVPIVIEGTHLTVAFANPLDFQILQRIRETTGLAVRPAIAREESIREVLGSHRSATTDKDLASLVYKDSEGLSLNTPPSENAAGDDFSEFDTTLTSSDLSAAPVVRLANKIIADAIQKRASDIHVVPESEVITIQIRVDGIMHPLFTVPARVQNAVISRMKLLAGMDIAERRRPQDGRMRVKASSGVKDLRVSTVPTAFGESVVIRILSTDATKLNFSSLGLDPHTQQQLETVLKSSARVVLVTGPTGSGKTSTLYATLMMLHDGTNSIVTVEDPIEYKIEGINQIQVNTKVNVSFAEGLRSILRQDPDVIMVGEIRDTETAEMAMQAAQTGHLVLSTLHTNSAASAFTRLQDIGLAPYIIASSVGTVVAQRLVRRLCQRCAVGGCTYSTELQKSLGIDANTVKQAKGCEDCDDSGYNGRVGVYSILDVNDSVREAIRLNKGEAEIESIARENGFHSLLEAGVGLVNEGVTSLEELERGLGSLEILVAEDQAQQARLGRSSKASTNTSALSRRRILLIEDDENTRTVLSMLLKREMFEVVEAEDGLDALEKVFDKIPELILCDLMMPRMGGIEFLQRLRKDKRAREIPVLMLTAADGEENELSSLNSGADDFVSKASDSRVMLARVHRLLERGE